MMTYPVRLDLNFGLYLFLHLYFVHASSEGSGESVYLLDYVLSMKISAQIFHPAHAI